MYVAQIKKWSAKKAKAPEPPRLNQNQWNVAGTLSVVLVVMGICQAVSFSSFKRVLTGLGLDAPTAWAIALILAEVWAATAFYRIKLDPRFRLAGLGLALAIAGFWFVLNVQAVSNDLRIPNSGFFGRYIAQAPSGWTLLEASLFLGATLYIVDMIKNRGK